MNSLTPRMVVLLRHMRVLTSDQSTVSTPQYKYLTSTHLTQIVKITPENATTFSTIVPSVAHLLDLASQRWSFAAIAGGIFPSIISYVPDSLQELRNPSRLENDMEITPSSQWQDMVSSLAYRETKTVKIHAYIAAVHIHFCDDDMSFYRNRSTSAANISEDDRYPPSHASFVTKDGASLPSITWVKGVKFAGDQDDFGFIARPNVLNQINEHLEFLPSLYNQTVQDQSSRSSALTVHGERGRNILEYMVLLLCSLTPSNLILPVIVMDPDDTLGNLTADPVINLRRYLDELNANQHWLCCLRLHQPGTLDTELLLDRILPLT